MLPHKYETYLLRLENFLEHWFGMFAAITVSVVISLFSLLFGFQVANGFTNIEQQLMYFFINAIRHGDSILWNPYNFSGFPSFVDSIHVSPLLYAGGFLMNPPIFYYWSVAIFFIASGFCMAILLRLLGVSVLGQYVGALVYMLVPSFNSFWELSVLESFFLLPFLMILVLMIERSPRLWHRFGWALIGSIIVAFGWIGAHWHFLINALLVGFLFSCYQMFFAAHAKKCSWYRFLYVPLFYIFSAIFGTILGVIKLGPAFVIMSLSGRIEGFSTSALAGEGFWFTNIFTFISPTFYHPLLSASPEFVYLGLLPIFLAILVFTLRFFKKESFFSYLLIVSILVGFRNSFLFSLLQKIPPFNFTHSSSRWIFILGFSIAGLCSFAIDRVLKKDNENRYMRFAKIFRRIAGFSIILGIAGSFATYILYRFRTQAIFLITKYFDHYLYNTALSLSLDYYHDYLSNMLSKALLIADITDPHFFVALLFLAITYVLLSEYTRNRLQIKQLAQIFVVVIAAHTIVMMALLPERSDANKAQDPPESVKFLQSHNHNRIISYLQGAIETQSLEDYWKGNAPLERHINLSSAFLLPSANIQFQIENAGYFSSIQNQSMIQLVDYLGGAVAHGTDTLSNPQFSRETQARLFENRKPILDLLGVSHILSSYPLDERVFTKVFTSLISPENIPAMIYENKGYRPMYYTTSEKSLIDLPSTTTPSAIQRIIETERRSNSISQNDIAVKKQLNGLLELDSSFSREEILVFSQNFLPGWVAYVDGDIVPIHSFATVYQAITVPAGSHEIRFVYQYDALWGAFTQLLKSKI